ncbi:thioredoxin domain-containing protein [Ditylenchus destructor]|nr:thioredoxin domain-containing protein [Ditylenchus destructor]
MKLFVLFLLGIFATPAVVTALFDSSDDVVELTSSNFQNRVLNDDAVWIVEFYAPWCGHCKNLVPEYRKTAKALKGLVKVGAVDMTQHESLGSPYGVRGFPTIKIFGSDKKKPSDYNGQRTAQSLVESAINEVKKIANARLGISGSGKSGSGGGKVGNDVVELTDSNFEQLVLKSKDLWLVEFFAPWCGHCKTLEPHWKAAASELKGKVKLGAVDATVHTMLANKFNVRGFPTIKFFGAGEKTDNSAVDYDGGRTTNDIVQWATIKASENLPPPELKQATSSAVLQESCKDKQLCIVTFLPHILDCQSKCRNDYLQLLKELADKFKKNPWGWVWAEAGQQSDLEEAFGIGGFGYPALIAVNSRKMKYSTLTGSFGKDGISEFLRDLSYGKGKTSSMKGTEFPKVHDIEQWDGKDGAVPELDDIDLSDVELDDIEPTKNEL